MSDILGFRRKRTATERSESNADPLVIRKKAREAAKSNTAADAIATQVATVRFNIFEVMNTLT
jgi:hypothetical protein